MQVVWVVPVILESKFHEPAPCHSSMGAGHRYDPRLMEIKKGGWCQGDDAFQLLREVKTPMLCGATATIEFTFIEVL
jgi:hypothetical protein